MTSEKGGGRSRGQPQKILLIGNPVSGYGAARSTKIRALMGCVKQLGYRLEIFFTASAGDARRRAGAIEPNVDILMVAGGDGTLNEVINGLKNPSQFPILLYPTGTSNVMARELKLPKSVENVAKVLQERHIKRVDMGMIGDHRFVLFVGAGFDGMVVEEVWRRKRTGAGHLQYLVPILKVCRRYRPPRLRVQVDDGQEIYGGMVLVGNTRCYGGIFSVTDLARCDSGLLDICVLPASSIRHLFTYAWAGWRGTISRLPEGRYVKGRRVLIDSERPVAVQVDGDFYGNTPVVMEIQPSTVPMVVPPEEGG